MKAKVYVLIFAVIFALCGCTLVEWRKAEKLDDQVAELYKQGRYAEAIPLAEKALAIWEEVYREIYDG